MAGVYSGRGGLGEGRPDGTMAAARARWAKASGRIRCGSVADFEAEVTEFLGKGALFVGGDGLPAPLQPFEFEFELPGGHEPIPLTGMIVAQPPGGALVQILN